MRTVLYRDDGSMFELIRQIAVPDAATKTAGEIFPTDIVPVIANNRRMSPSVFSMRWGYTAADGKPVINARSETASEKTMFRDGMLQRRCLIPATRYFEWDGGTKYAIAPSDQSFFCMAGIYRMEQGRPVFSILTKSPVDSIAFIHNRMPVILPEDSAGDWLDMRFSAADVIRAAVGNVQYQEV